MEFIMVVGHDLIEKDGEIYLGIGTMETCNRAAELYLQRSYSKEGLNPTLVITAGMSPKHRVMLGQAMADYIISENSRITEHHILVAPSHRFNTSGEMEALARLLKKQQNLDRVIIVTKWWHGPRCALLWRYWRMRHGIWGLSSFVSGHASSSSWSEVFREYLLAFPWNAIREIFSALFSLIRWLVIIWWRMPA